MIVYVDSSVTLRVVLHEPGPLDWDSWERAYSSVLLRIEAGRALHRITQAGGQSALAESERASSFEQFHARLRIVALSADIARVAAGPFPTPVKALDAIHIATALSIAKQQEPQLVFATHDRQQAAAAESIGLPVVGI